MKARMKESLVDLYKKALPNELGWKYHTANIRSIDEAREVYKLIKQIKG